jgi:hypothetical protein
MIKIIGHVSRKGGNFRRDFVMRGQCRVTSPRARPKARPIVSNILKESRILPYCRQKQELQKDQEDRRMILDRDFSR